MTNVSETIKVQGMICRQCEDIISRRLLHTRGVISAHASYFKSSVYVTFDPKITSVQELESAIEASGYPVGGGGISGLAVDLISLAAVGLLVFLIRLMKSGTAPMADSDASLGYIFLVGLLTSTHCLGMCGGILLSQTTDDSVLLNEGARRSRRGIFASLTYNGGRVLSYTLVGAIWGALGAVISYTLTFKSIVFTMAGAIVAIIGIQMSGIIPGLRLLSPDLPSFCQLPVKTKNRYLGKPLIIGLLTGLMPCAALQAMWIYAMGTGSAFSGALAMLLFSLGTVPLMFLFGALNSFIPLRFTKYIPKASAVLIIAMGISMLISGIQLMQ